MSGGQPVAAEPPFAVATISRVSATLPDETQEEFGGFSALEIDPSTGNLIALSDGAWMARFSKTHPPDLLSFAPIGLRTRNPYFVDSESLRLAPNGDWWVGFERYNRLEAHRPGWQSLPDVPAERIGFRLLEDLPSNNGIEALAILPTGELLALAEFRIEAPAYLIDPETLNTQRFTFRGRHPPADAVALDDGGLLVLTRDWRWPMPPLFSAYIEYVPAGWQNHPTIEGRVLLELDAHLPAENYEGLAIQQQPNGDAHLWLISDDNFLVLQETLLVEIHVPKACFDRQEPCGIQVR